MMLRPLVAQAVQGYRATAEGQATSARKEAEQLRERSSVSQAAQQQLLLQLAEAEGALSSSRLTSSRLLQEGQRLEAEVRVFNTASHHREKQPLPDCTQSQRQACTLLLLPPPGGDNRSRVVHKLGLDVQPPQVWAVHPSSQLHHSCNVLYCPPPCRCRS